MALGFPAAEILAKKVLRHMTRLVLASASPRRSALLRQLDLSFEVMAMNIDESMRNGESAQDYVIRLSLEKARAAESVLQGTDCVVLAADTTVVLGEKILGKPVNQADGIAMLKALSGNTHQVLTGVSVISRQQQDSLFVQTAVTFRELEADEINQYWLSGEPADKAGGYGLQGAGAAFVSTLDGSYSNVIGLPLSETVLLLRSHGVRVLGSPARTEQEKKFQGGHHG